jgi:hypothetical protein
MNRLLIDERHGRNSTVIFKATNLVQTCEKNVKIIGSGEVKRITEICKISMASEFLNKLKLVVDANTCKYD